jgi:hypothetical protein
MPGTAIRVSPRAPSRIRQVFTSRRTKTAEPWSARSACERQRDRERERDRDRERRERETERETERDRERERLQMWMPRGFPSKQAQTWRQTYLASVVFGIKPRQQRGREGSWGSWGVVRVVRIKRDWRESARMYDMLRGKLQGQLDALSRAQAGEADLRRGRRVRRRSKRGLAGKVTKR